MDYYTKKQLVATVDRNNNITGSVEKWKAHKQGILHKGFTVVLTYKGQYVLQHRKHPAFDGYFDLTFSSHPVYVDGILEDDFTAIYQALKRELNIEKKDLAGVPIYKGVVWYKAKDPNSEFTEHEMDSIYMAKIKKLPQPNFTYSYGLSLQSPDQIKDKNSSLTKLLVPWVRALLQKKLI